MEEPVFILGSHKSGTSLLRSLFDGAGEFFVIPIEAHFFQYSGHWVDYALRRALPQVYAFDDLVDRFAQHIQHANRTTFEESRTSDSATAGWWDVPRFVDYLREQEARYRTGGMRAFIDSYVEAMHVSLHGSPPEARRFVEKSVENAEFAVLLQSLYPKARFIHVIRNPYATLVAIRKHGKRTSFPFLWNALASLENAYYYLYKNPLLIESYKIVCYEDLVSDTEGVMRDIACFVEVPFHEAFLNPTTMGAPWPGNSTTDQRFHGISTLPLKAWRDEVLPLEVGFINYLFPHVLDDYGYPRVESKRSVYSRCPQEGVRTYLANRLLWRLLHLARKDLLSRPRRNPPGANPKEKIHCSHSSALPPV